MEKYLKAKDASREAVTLRRDSSLHDARNAMLDHDVSRVVMVTRDCRPVGIITGKDIMRLIYRYASRRPLDRIRLDQVMSTNLITANEESSLGVCAKLMMDNDVSSVIVTDNKYTLRGICAKTDMVNICAEHFAKGHLIEDFMTKKVFTVSPEETLGRILLLMTSNHISRLVITEGRKPVGIIAGRDLLPLGSLVDPYFNKFAKSYETEGLAGRSGAAFMSLGIKGIFKAKDVMKGEPIMITNDLDLVDAARIMKRNRISGLPVVGSTHDANLVGIVTKTDVTRALACISNDGGLIDDQHSNKKG